MKFRLLHEGDLFSSQPTDNKALTKQAVKLAKHRMEIRRKIHRQLASLWRTYPVLTSVQYCKKFRRNHALEGPDDDSYPHDYVPLQEHIVASIPQLAPYQFCPLVSTPLGLACSLDILILRQDGAGGVYRAGDLDNRVKTLIDGLAMPNSKDGFAEFPMPGPDEQPFFTLMQSDNIIEGLRVETDRRHEPRPENSAQSELAWVTVVISVEVRPYNPNLVNLSFV